MKPIFTGKIDNIEHFLKTQLSFVENSSSLKDNITNDIIIESIINYMENNFEYYKATVTDKTTKEEKLMIDRRTSAKKTFENLHFYNTNNEITSIFESIKETQSNIEEIIIEPTHFDLIYYRKGGEFKFHSDTISPENPGINYHFYTLLIGLVDTDKGGETLIVNSNTNKILSYPESAQKYKYVFFPSDEKHAGSKIEEGIKLCFKFDAWIKFKTHEIEDKPISFETAALQDLIKNIISSNKYIYNNILKTNRIYMANKLPNRIELNQVIPMAFRYIETLKHFRDNYDSLHDILYDYYEQHPKPPEGIFTESSNFIMRYGIDQYYDEHIDRYDNYDYDYDDDDFCNGDY
jgi:hypothetical protein